MVSAARWQIGVLAVASAGTSAVRLDAAVVLIVINVRLVSVSLVRMVLALIALALTSVLALIVINVRLLSVSLVRAVLALIALALTSVLALIVIGVRLLNVSLVRAVLALIALALTSVLALIVINVRLVSVSLVRITLIWGIGGGRRFMSVSNVHVPAHGKWAVRAAPNALGVRLGTAREQHYSGERCSHKHHCHGCRSQSPVHSNGGSRCRVQLHCFDLSVWVHARVYYTKVKMCQHPVASGVGGWRVTSGRLPTLRRCGLHPSPKQSPPTGCEEHASLGNVDTRLIQKFKPGALTTQRSRRLRGAEPDPMESVG